jgi:hypothetical protein
MFLSHVSDSIDGQVSQSRAVICHGDIAVHQVQLLIQLHGHEHLETQGLLLGV